MPEPNPLVTKSAEALIDKVRETVLASIKDETKNFATVDQLEGLKKFVADEMTKNLESNLQSIIDSKKFPTIRTSSAWKVKSQITGREVEMEYSLGRILHVLRAQKERGAFPTEKLYDHEVEFVKRTITEGSSSAGGTLIPQEWTDFVIPELGAKVVFMKGGPNVLPMQHQVLNIPGLTNNATYSWIGENGSISESAPATNNTPLTLHALKGLTGVSIEWLRDATPETDAALQANLVRGASRAVDAAYFNGTGGGTQPTGIFQVSGISSNGAGGGATNGSTPTLDDISITILALDQANAPEDNRVWFCHPRTVDRLRRIKNTLGDPILWTNPANALDMRLNGYPILTTTQIPINQTQGSSSTASEMALVAMSDMFVGQGIRSQGLELAISDQALFSTAEIAIRLIYRTDLQPGHVLSIAALVGIL